MSPSLPRRALSVVLFAIIAARCGGSTSPTGPSSTGQTLPAAGESANYIFRAAEGDTVNPAWQERYHEWLTATLDVAPRQRIIFNKYTSRGHMQSVIGVGNTNAWADPAAYAIHTIWPIDNHEVVHLLTSAWGSPAALINEGMAVAFQIDPARDQIPRWSGTPLHDLTRQFRQQGRFVPLAQLTETSGFRSHDSNVTYPESGSFMRWLIDAHDLARVRALYARAAGPSASAGTIRAAFADVYGRSLDQLEQDWIAFLAQ